MFPRIEKDPIEYRVSIFPALDKRDKSPVIRFHFETSEEFHYFRYQLTIDTKSARDALTFRIKGLKPQILSIPQDGHAMADVDLPIKNGRYKVKVTKPGDVSNTFGIAVDGPDINLEPSILHSLTFLQVVFQEN